MANVPLTTLVTASSTDAFQSRLNRTLQEYINDGIAPDVQFQTSKHGDFGTIYSALVIARGQA